MEGKTRIFVSAYACEPNLGSEIGVGWHWVLAMSKYFDLWVLTRKSNERNIEAWIKENKAEDNIHFIYWDLPKILRFWKKGLHGVRTYYFIWQKMTNRIVKRQMEKNNIQIYHLLTYGNSLWPASNYGMSKFFVWGPTGGVDSIPKDYTKYYTKRWKLIEGVRRTMVKLLPINAGFLKRCRKADLIFCKSYSLLESIPKKYRSKAMIFTDVAVEPKDVRQYLENRDVDNGTIRYLAVGRLDAWRGFDILIEAFAKAATENRDIRLEILGEGSDYNRLMSLIEKLNMKKFITMSGQVSMEEYYKRMANCDVVVNPSLKEGAVTTAFDSLSFGKALIGIDTGGYTRYFAPEYSIIIPRKSRKDTVKALEESILRLTDENTRKSFGINAKEVSGDFTWLHKGEKIYNEVMQRYNCHK